MTILSRLARLTNRTISYQSVFANGGDVSYGMGGVSPKSASGLVAFMSAVRLLTDDISTLPMGAFVKLNGQAYPVFPRPEWIDSPVPANPNLTRAAHVSEILASLLFDGNAFLYVLPDVAHPAEITVVNPGGVDVKKNPATSAPLYVIDRQKFGPEQIIHIPLVKVPGEPRGLSFVESARRSISAGLSIDEFAGGFFKRGLAPGAVMKFPAGVKVSDDQAAAYRDQFERNHAGAERAHRLAIVDQGASLEGWTLTPEQAQFIETRLANVEEIARLFRIPPPMLGINAPGAVSYSSVEQQSINYVVHTIRPYLERIEQAYSRLLPVRADGTRPYVKFNVAGLLRGDLQSRYQAYSIGMQAGFLTTDDVRRLEDMAPLPGGDQQRVPLTHALPEDVDTGARVDMAAKLVNAGFDPEAVMANFGLPPIKHLGLPPVTVQPERNDLAIPTEARAESEQVVRITQPAPVVNVAPPEVTVDLAPVRVAMSELTDRLADQLKPKPVRRRVERDAQQRIVGLVEEPVEEDSPNG